MPFTVIRQDITKMDVDAIVNAANRTLRMGGGVCGAIFSAAGSDALQKECDAIGYCATGEAVITKGYNLKAKFVIHTVGPVYEKGNGKQADELYCCYKNSLKLAKENGLESIAFPLISSGIYGYPKDEALVIAREAIGDFLKENEMEIYLVVYDKAGFKMSEKLFEAVKSYIDERFVKPDYRRMPDECSYEALEMPRLNKAMEEVCEKSTKRSLESLVNKKAETFSEMLLRLIDEKGFTDVEVYKRANIDRKLFSKIRKKDYQPKKLTAMALIIGLRLNMDEAKDLLGRAGYAFSECSKTDVIVEFFIENRIYDIYRVNEALFTFEQPLLGA